jgi:hypothetical protein
MDSILLACYGDRLEDKDSYSFLSSEWDPLPLHQRTKAWMQERWSEITANSNDVESEGEETADSDDNRKLPARPSKRPASPLVENSNLFLSSRVRAAPSALDSSPKRVRRSPAPTAAAPRRGTRVTAATPPPLEKAAFTVADLGPLISEILKAQEESTMQLHQTFQTNMMANIQAT